MPLVKKETAKKILDTIETVENLPDKRKSANGKTIPRRGIAYIKLTADNDDNNFDGEEVEYDTTTHDWETMTNGRTWGNGEGEVNLIVVGGEVDQIVKAQAVNTADNEIVWVGVPMTGGTATVVYVEITASTSISQYTATIYDNPTDRNQVEASVTVYAKKHDAGTLPNSASGKGLWAMKGNDGKYYLIDYSVFHST